MKNEKNDTNPIVSLESVSISIFMFLKVRKTNKHNTNHKILALLGVLSTNGNTLLHQMSQVLPREVLSSDFQLWLNLGCC